MSATDSWGEPSTSAIPVTRRVPAEAIPDDWDNDEEEEEDNQTIWELANNKAPMPELVIAPSSTAPSVISPPPSALQAPMRILKRPSMSPSSSDADAAASSDSRNAKSLAEREAQYHAARERIFGDALNKGSVVALLSSDSSAASKRTLNRSREADGPPVTSIVRNPRGPDDTTGGVPATPKGFQRRQKSVGGKGDMPTKPHPDIPDRKS